MDSTRLDELLDWLAEEVAARLRTSAGAISVAPPAGPPRYTDGPEQPAPGDLPVTGRGQEGAASPPIAAAGEAGAPSARPAEAGPAVAEAQTTGPAPTAPAEEPLHELPPLDSAPAAAGLPSHGALLLSRLAIGLLIAVVLINIPLGWHGAALARIIPSSASLVVRSGLLVKESDKPEVYVYQDGKFRWIADLEVFQRYGYEWEHVQVVAPGFLASYQIGRPLYLVAKCPGSPHIYRLENGVKRWIVDIAAFEAEGYQWSDVQTVDCYTLAAMPMGETIPPGRGPAPQP